jgi:hypothetical protein
MNSPGANDVVIVTAADSHFFPLLRDMLRSLAEHTKLADCTVAVIDLGLTEDELQWTREHVDLVTVPSPYLPVPEYARTGHFLGYLVRPFLREHFPGFRTYVWIDADVWLQSWSGIETLLDGARDHGMAIAHEREKAYTFQAWLFLWTAKHFILGFGLWRGPWLLSKPHLNAGVFAIRSDAPHWVVWQKCYQAAIDRTGKVTPHDQFALNQAIYQYRLPTKVVAPLNNWICGRGVPQWDPVSSSYCEPLPPFRKIATMHLAGEAKTRIYDIEIRTGGSRLGGLRRSQRPVPEDTGGAAIPIPKP